MKPLGTPDNHFEIRAEKALSAFSILNARDVAYRPARSAVASPSYDAVESRTFDISLSGTQAGYFLRLGIDEVADLVDGDTAFAAATGFHKLGVSPEPIGFDAQTRGTLFRHLGEGWRTAKIDDLMASDMAARLIEIQSVIGKGSPLGRQWSVFGGIEQLWHIVTASDAELPGDADWMRSWMLAYIEADLCHDISLAGLAEQAGLSPRHFLRAFKQTFGETPCRYARASLMREAQAKLLTTPTPIAEIALDLGFGNFGNFSTAFRKHTGVPPEEFRRRYS